MAAENKDYALAIGRAIKAVDSSIIYVALAGSEMEKAGHKLGLRVALEGFCDRQYDDDGNLTSRKIPGSVLKDPAVACKQVIDMVVNTFITSRRGKTMSVMTNARDFGAGNLPRCADAGNPGSRYLR